MSRVINESVISNEDKLDAILLLENGETVENVAQIFGTSVATITSWVENKSCLETQKEIIDTEFESDSDEKNKIFKESNNYFQHSYSRVRKKRRSKYSNDIVLKILKLYEDNHSVKNIASDLNMSGATVYSLIKKNFELSKKIVPKDKRKTRITFTNAEKLEAINMYENNHSIDSIAFKFNAAYKTVYKWTNNKEKFILRDKQRKDFERITSSIRKTHFKANRNGKKFTLDDKLEAIKLYENNHSVASIAKSFNINSSFIYYWIKIKDMIKNEDRYEDATTKSSKLFKESTKIKDKLNSSKRQSRKTDSPSNKGIIIRSVSEYQESQINDDISDCSETLPDPAQIKLESTVQSTWDCYSNDMCFSNKTSDLNMISNPMKIEKIVKMEIDNF